MAIEAKRASALAAIGLHHEVLNEKLQLQLENHSNDDIATLTRIHGKLNNGLPERLKAAADTVGGFVW